MGKGWEEEEGEGGARRRCEEGVGGGGARRGWEGYMYMQIKAIKIFRLIIQGKQ